MSLPCTCYTPAISLGTFHNLKKYLHRQSVIRFYFTDKETYSRLFDLPKAGVTELGFDLRSLYFEARTLLTIASVLSSRSTGLWHFM